MLRILMLAMALTMMALSLEGCFWLHGHGWHGHHGGHGGWHDGGWDDGGGHRGGGHGSGHGGGRR